MSYIHCVNPKAMLLSILGVLVVAATTASVMATQSTIAPPQSLGAAMSPAAVVKGAVTYGERALSNGQRALSGKQVLAIQLVDLTKAGEPAVVLGEHMMQITGQSAPFAFEIGYDPAAIEPNGVYGVAANVTVDGQLMLQSATVQVAMTQDHTTTVQVMLAETGSWWSILDLPPGAERLAHFSH